MIFLENFQISLDPRLHLVNYIADLFQKHTNKICNNICWIANDTSPHIPFSNCPKKLTFSGRQRLPQVKIHGLSFDFMKQKGTLLGKERNIDLLKTVLISLHLQPMLGEYRGTMVAQKSMGEGAFLFPCTGINHQAGQAD